MDADLSQDSHWSSFGDDSADERWDGQSHPVSARDDFQTFLQSSSPAPAPILVKFFHPLCLKMVVTERLSVINRSEDHSYEEAREAIVKERNLMIEIGMLESHLNDESDL
jgi:hypothetical protein